MGGGQFIDSNCKPVVSSYNCLVAEWLNSLYSALAAVMTVVGDDITGDRGDFLLLNVSISMLIW